MVRGSYRKLFKVVCAIVEVIIQRAEEHKKRPLRKSVFQLRKGAFFPHKAPTLCRPLATGSKLQSLFPHQHFWHIAGPKTWKNLPEVGDSWLPFNLNDVTKKEGIGLLQRSAGKRGMEGRGRGGSLSLKWNNAPLLLVKCLNIFT